MNRTKKLISDIFWELLEEKPYPKITVRDIVERCQVNRNTFYYHFQDIPSLTEYTISEWADDIIRKNYQPDSPISCIRPLAEACIQRKKALSHLYQSADRDMLTRNMNRVCYNIMGTYVDCMNVPEQDREIVTRYYKCVFTGIMADWFDAGTSYDLLEFMQGILERGLAGSPPGISEES